MLSSHTKSSIVQKIQYDANLGQLYKIFLLNLIFKICTFGIYTFWGRTRMRKYIARCLSLCNDRFEYTGKGREMFISFLKATGILSILAFTLGVTYFSANHVFKTVLGMPFVMEVIDTILSIVYLPALFFLIYAALYGALRYRFSKTRWRGIRFHLSGSSFDYAKFAMGRTFLSILSFGILIPKSSLEKTRRIIDNMSYGNLKFSMNYHTHNLNKLNIITLLLAIPTLALSRIWFHIALQKFIFEHMHLGDIRFNYTMTPGKQLLLTIKQILLLIFTLGLGYPILLKMAINALVHNIEIMGDLDSLKVGQSEHSELTSGEGLEGVFGESFI